MGVQNHKLVALLSDSMAFHFSFLSSSTLINSQRHSVEPQEICGGLDNFLRSSLFPVDWNRENQADF